MILFPPERLRGILDAPRGAVHSIYDAVWAAGPAAVAELGRKDRFFLLTWLLGRRDADRDWLYARCREVEASPDGYLDLWAREHYKSTIITFAGAIQEIMKDPEITIGIFSHNRPTAKKFMRQIKHELESNERLKAVYPDVLYSDPEKSAPRWSEDQGIVVRRQGNPKEATVEAHGLIEGMPTGAHYRLRIYDDVVTEDSVTTPEMMEKTTAAWRLSQNLGVEGIGRVWHIGTRYHFNDTYRTILEDRICKPRLYPATDDGTPSGRPVLISPESLAEKRVLLGSYIFACQQLLNPVADEAQGFRREWLRYHDGHSGEGLNRYILVDPANEKKKWSDYSAFFVVGLGADRNYYVLDMLRDRLNLTERAEALFALHRRWAPRAVGYEKYGKDSDIQHFEDRMRRDNYRFHITALGGAVRKEDRIRRLVPLFEQGRVWLPECLERTDTAGRRIDLARAFVEQEYLGFPVAVHDDMLDCLSRIADPGLPVVWPKGEGDAMPNEKPRRYRPQARDSGHTWMSI